MITLKPVQEKDRTLLWNLLQKYLCEMTNYYDNELDGEGNFPYRYFADYFRESDREALLILSGDRIAGFALLNGHSYLGLQPDRVIGEFFVLPAFRRRHIAARAAQLLFFRHPGSWEVKFNCKNTAAAAFWTKITGAFRPEIHVYAESERVICFSTSLPRLRHAKEADMERIYALIDSRIRWMDEVGLKQWNVTDYWGVYPRSHYIEKMQAGELYVLEEDGCTSAVAALYAEDPRWEDAAPLPAFYVHHLATDRRFPGAGRRMLTAIEAHARECGKACVRLDCSEDNPRLNAYYEDAGYRPMGTCIDGVYVGLRREKLLGDLP